MRILQYYRFPVKTKIPFDKWPGIIEEYLHRQNLTHHAFHYRLENYDFSDNFRAVLDGTKCKTCGAPELACERCRKEASDYLRKSTPCQRAQKENPFLGPIRIRQTEYETIQSLDNFSEASNDCKEAIYAIIPKIYRRYGFTETSLIYRDIDFFSRRFPSPAPGSEYLMNGYAGSGITLYRSCLSQDNAIILSVESRYPGEVPDATPYADALGELLPGVKRISTTTIIMEKEERERYDEIQCKAQPLVLEAKNFLEERIPDESNYGAAAIGVASLLKKLGRQHGYTYLGYDYYVYFLQKKLPGGHYICLEFVSNPAAPTADPYVSLCGLGFRHEVWCSGFCPQNAREAAAYLTHFFETLDEAEKTVFSAILDLYPPTPDWFMPAH